MATVQRDLRRNADASRRWSWRNTGTTPVCWWTAAGEVHRVLAALDVTPETVEEAARKGCELIVSHHPVIFSAAQKALSPAGRALPAGAAGHLRHLHAHQSGCSRGRRQRGAGGPVWNAGNWEAFAEGCGRVGSIDPIAVPELARKAQQQLAPRCNLPRAAARPCRSSSPMPASPVRRLAVISGAGRQPALQDAHGHGGGLPADRRSQPPPRTSTRSVWGFRSSRLGHYATEFPVTGVGGRKAARSLPGAGSAREHRGPGPVYLSIRKAVLRCVKSSPEGGSFHHMSLSAFYNEVKYYGTWMPRHWR